MSSAVATGTCGIGKITALMEGGWNSDNFVVVIDYSDGQSSHPTTANSGHVIYQSTLNEKRLNGIKSLAIAAFMSGKVVDTYSHNDNCSSATQLIVR